MRALQLHTHPAVPLQRHHNKPDPNQILTTTPHSATNCARTVRATTRADAQARTRRHTARCVYPHAPHRTPHTSQHILHTLRFTTDRTHTPLRTTTTSHVTTMAASFPPCSACPRPRSSSRQQCAQPAMAGQQPLSSLRLGNHPVPRKQRRRAQVRQRLHRMCRKSGRWLLRQVRACPKTAAGRPSAIHPHRASPSPALRLIALDSTILTETRSQTWPWGKIRLNSREIFYQEIPVRGVQARAVQARGGRAEASERCHGGSVQCAGVPVHMH